MTVIYIIKEAEMQLRWGWGCGDEKRWVLEKWSPEMEPRLSSGYQVLHSISRELPSPPALSLKDCFWLLILLTHQAVVRWVILLSLLSQECTYPFWIVTHLLSYLARHLHARSKPKLPWQNCCIKVSFPTTKCNKNKLGAGIRSHDQELSVIFVRWFYWTCGVPL